MMRWIAAIAMCLFLQGCVYEGSFRPALVMANPTPTVSPYQNAKAVGEKLRQRSGGTQLLTFRIKAKDELEPILFNYVSELGGTVLEGGRPEFSLEVDQSKKRHSQRIRMLTTTVSIKALRDISGGRVVLFLSTSKRECLDSSARYSYPPKCDEMREVTLKEALYRL